MYVQGTISDLIMEVRLYIAIIRLKNNIILLHEKNTVEHHLYVFIGYMFFLKVPAGSISG